MKITAIIQRKEQIHVISSGFSFKKINENIEAINGTRLIITNALATLVLASARINVMLDPRIKSAFIIPDIVIETKDTSTDMENLSIDNHY